MYREHWLPYGTEVAPSVAVGRLVRAGSDWQVVEARHGGRVLLVEAGLASRWQDAGIVQERELLDFREGGRLLKVLDGGERRRLSPVAEGLRGGHDLAAAARFAKALGATRRAGEVSSLRDAIYAERLGRLLPTYDDPVPPDDAMLLGRWLCGGLSLDATSPEMAVYLRWMPADDLASILQDACLSTKPETSASKAMTGDEKPMGPFRLPGRRALEHFFNEHVIDVVQNREAYASLGLSNPPGVVLEGPPGCGKTFAVERLVAFLGWEAFEIEAASVASPYIHETSRKVFQVFGEAISKAPSVIVIDEMDAFLAARDDGGSSQHRTEEIAEFLRRIPQAVAAGVLVIGMTNRKKAIDPAILRRGRFDHVIHVGMPDAEEVLNLLESLAAGRPLEADVRLEALASRLAGRPLSDGSFVMREAARVAARRREASIGMDAFEAALANLLAKA